MQDKRINPNECPIHKRHFLWRKDDMITCSMCDWVGVPARRIEDKKIPLYLDVKENWR